MGTNAETVRIPSDALPGTGGSAAATPEFVEDLDGLSWHELRGYAKLIGVSLVENGKLHTRERLTAAVRARQTGMWPVRVAGLAVPNTANGPGPPLSLPSDDDPVDMVVGHGVAEIVDGHGYQSQPSKPCTCIGCGVVMEDVPSGSNNALCARCSAGHAAALAGAVRQQDAVNEGEEIDDPPAFTAEEIDALLKTEPALVAAETPRAKEASLGEPEPPGTGPWALRSRHYSKDKLVIRQGRFGRPLPDGGEIPRMPEVAVQFRNYEATVSSRKLMKAVMKMEAWRRGEITFKQDIMKQGLVAREADLIIDKARTRGLRVPDRQELIDALASDQSVNDVADRTARGVAPARAKGKPALNYGPISTRPKPPIPVVTTGEDGVTRGPRGSGADIEFVE